MDWAVFGLSVVLAFGAGFGTMFVLASFAWWAHKEREGCGRGGAAPAGRDGGIIGRPDGVGGMDGSSKKT